MSVFDDRVEVLSPGTLYGGLDLEAALGGKSKCRNAAVSEAFYYMKIIEAWGTGLGRIQNSCKEYGLKKPAIEEFGDGFRVILYRKMNGEEPAGVGNDSRAESGAEEKENPAIRQSGDPAIRQSGNPVLTEQEQIIIRYVHEQRGCTTAAIAELLDLRNRQTRGILGGLVKKGILEKVGNARNTSYRAGECFPWAELRKNEVTE